MGRRDDVSCSRAFTKRDADITPRIVAQIIGPQTIVVDKHSVSDDGLDLVSGPGRRQYASLHWADLWAVAPWMRSKVTRTIDGAGL
jgi:hypothetical protein